eukprot:9489691-Pyramimonas_sp.AAC.1
MQCLPNVAKKLKQKTCKSGAPPNYYTVPTSDIASTMLAYCWLSLVTIGGIVYELRGLPIGGVLSGVILSMLLAWFEFRACKDPERFRSMGFQIPPTSGKVEIRQRRYVDGILGISKVYCRQCVYLYLSQ